MKPLSSTDLSKTKRLEGIPEGETVPIQTASGSLTGGIEGEDGERADWNHELNWSRGSGFR